MNIVLKILYFTIEIHVWKIFNHSYTTLHEENIKFLSVYSLAHFLFIQIQKMYLVIISKPYLLHAYV